MKFKQHEMAIFAGMTPNHPNAGMLVEIYQTIFRMR